ncbi:MAG: DMT family transporter, partial [Geminicoccaceae bacterium]
GDRRRRTALRSRERPAADLTGPMRISLAAAPANSLVYARSASLVVLAGILWSMGGFLVKLVEHADSMQIVLYRSLFVIPVAAGFMVFRGADLVRSTLALGWNGLFGAVCLAAAFVTFVTALTLTTVANAAFVLATTPFAAALLGRLFLSESVRPSTWLAMALAASGVAVIALPGLGPGRLAGTLLALASCLSFALFSITLRRGRSLDGTPSLLMAAILAAAACAVLILLLDGPSGLVINHRDVLACSVMGVVQIGCGLVAFTAGSRHLPAADLALLTQTEVVLAPVWAWLVVGEIPAFWTMVGGTMVLAAVTLQAVAGARRTVWP